jgi:SAM-dependent methyltransferase
LAGIDIADSDYWDRVWDTSQGSGTIGLRPWYPENRLWDGLFRRLLVKFPAGSKLLEIGCAPGRWMIYFRENLGFDAWGIDYSPSGVEVAKHNIARHRTRAQVVEGNFLEYQFPLKFDVIVSFGVIEHYLNPMPVITKCLEDLREGGLCICAVPNIASTFYGGIQKSIDSDVWGKHVAYNMEDLISFFDRAGFVRIKGTYFGCFNLGVVNVSKFQKAAPFLHASNLILHLMLRSMVGTRESPLWSPYIFVWGEKRASGSYGLLHSGQNGR